MSEVALTHTAEIATLATASIMIASAQEGAKLSSCNGDTLCVRVH